MDDFLVLVDSADNEIGYNEKNDVHIKRQLHRAFSLFIYDKTENKVLLHRRARRKYHSGGLWTNSCCSHPRKEEKLADAIIRRTYEELGLDIAGYRDSLIEAGKFHYFKQFEKCAENEIDHVFVLILEKQPVLNINTDEIEEIRWQSVEEIFAMIGAEPEQFTAWFSEAFTLAAKKIGER